MRLFFFITLSFCAFAAYGQSTQTIGRLLEDLKKQALQIQASESRQKANQLDLNRSLYFLEPTAFIRGGYENTDTPPTSPFSPSNSSSQELELGVSKQWSQGFKTSFNYHLEDSETKFPTRPDFNFIAPQMSLSLESNIFQDLIYQRIQNQQIKIKWEKDIVGLETKIEKKNVLVQGLIDFSMILEIQEELELQKQLCQSIETQADNLKRKRQRSTVSKREYLLGLKELTNCQASIELLERNYFEKTKNYSAKYNVEFKKYSSTKADQVFQEASKIYQNFNPKVSDVDIEKQDQVKVLN